jgi:predicted ribonuclease YlaK
MGRKSKAEPISCEEPKKILSCHKFKLDDMKPIEALTENQLKFFRAYDQGDYFIVLHGVAGSGKTFVAAAKAIQEVLTKGNLFHKVIIIRSAVQGREQGFLPGGLDEKMSEYEMPYVQIAHSLFGRKDAWDILKNSEKVEFMSTSFLRGSTFDNSVIIVDECQNMNYASELQQLLHGLAKTQRLFFVVMLDRMIWLEIKMTFPASRNFLMSLN